MTLSKDLRRRDRGTFQHIAGGPGLKKLPEVQEAQ
jgi:hypothetical protein